MWNKIKNIFKKNPTTISFKQGLDLTDVPVITVYQGDVKLNFMLDTGANRSLLDSRVLDKVEYQIV